MPLRTWRALAAAAMLVAALGPVGGVAAADAQTADPAQAVPLTRQLSGHLNPAGSFAYYKFFYPADGSVATINLEVVPDDSFLLQNVGFHVYAPNGSLVASGGAQPGLSPDVSANVIDSDPSVKGDLVVQVFDYDPMRPADFTIWVSGVPVQPAPAAAAPTTAPAPTPAPAPAPAQPGAAEAMKGRLGPGGSSAEYTFSYPGDQSVYTINLRVMPDDPAVLQLAGFEVYDPHGELVVRGGAQPGLTPNVAANVISRVPGRYLVKVYNYNATSAIDYEASIGVGRPPAEASASAY
ncbi:MAG TPA: hypothetical protein VG370_31110 [Chloroflexota bacterium]|jgi:hypothetical protein|nr:hypothetical protein [Chloroflexota bacterium]